MFPATSLTPPRPSKKSQISSNLFAHSLFQWSVSPRLDEFVPISAHLQSANLLPDEGAVTLDYDWIAVAVHTISTQSNFGNAVALTGDG